MKKIIIVFLVSFMLFGCTKETPDQLLMDAMNSKIGFLMKIIRKYYLRNFQYMKMT